MHDETYVRSNGAAEGRWCLPCSRLMLQPASLDDRIAAAGGHLNACYAALVELIREVIAVEAWHGFGIRSVEQWITWRTGLSTNHARTLVELAASAEAHPRVAAAFAAGEL